MEWALIEIFVFQSRAHDVMVVGQFEGCYESGPLFLYSVMCFSDLKTAADL